MFLGAREQFEELRKRYGGGARPGEFESWGTGIAGPVDAEAEAARVAAAFGATVDEMRRGLKRRARTAAYHHLVHRCGMTQTRVADFFGVSVAAVSYGLRGFQERRVGTKI